MKCTLPIILSALTSFSSAITIPQSASLGGISILDGTQIRIYYQNNTIGTGIREITTNQPTAAVKDDYQIYGGNTHPNTPLAALSWSGTGATSASIRLYYVTTRNTLGELAYDASTLKWNGGNDLGFPVLADSQAMYATLAANYLVVGYVNDQGNLAEAYYPRGVNGPWKTYQL